MWQSTFLCQIFNLDKSQTTKTLSIKCSVINYEYRLHNTLQTPFFFLRLCLYTTHPSSLSTGNWHSTDVLIYLGRKTLAYEARSALCVPVDMMSERILRLLKMCLFSNTKQRKCLSRIKRDSPHSSVCTLTSLWEPTRSSTTARFFNISATDLFCPNLPLLVPALCHTAFTL